MELKHAKDMEPRARHILQNLCKSLNIDLKENNKLFINFDEMLTKWLASELLEVYTNGINSWIEERGRENHKC